MAKRILKKYYIKGLRRLRHRRGHGVHSPFAFNLITTVIEESFMYYSYNEIEKIRQKDLRGILSAADRKRRKSITFKKASLLFRLANRFKPATILEIGSSWGISSLYLNSPRPDATHICIEPDSRVTEITQKVIGQLQSSIDLRCGNLPELLPTALSDLCSLDFVFIHRLKDVSAYMPLFDHLMNNVNSNTVVVIEDIHALKSIYACWQRIKLYPEVKVSMDLYDMGLLFCNEKLNKQHYVVAF